MSFKTIHALLVISTLLLASCVMAYSSDYPTSIDQFSGRFFQESVKQAGLKDKSAVMSAFSADQVMSMVSMSAKGETQKQILNALCLNNIDEAIPSIKKTNEDLRNIKGVTLKVANKIFAKPAANGKLDSIVPSYRLKLEDVFKSDVQQIDFSKSADAAKTINEWVEDNTNHRIKDLINEDSLSEDTTAVLVNAIYFKGSWNSKFDPAWTRKQNFTKSDGSQVLVDMMRIEKRFLHKYSEELKARIVVLPYEEKEVSMVIILPDKGANTIEQLEGKLSNGVNEYLQNLFEGEVTIGLPKMKIETKIDVKEVFVNLGATNVFTPGKANLEMVNGEGNIYVSEAVQKAFIEVNEEGAEAAAATGIEISLASLPPRIICDHSFIFLIKTEETVLFSGIYNGN